MLSRREENVQVNGFVIGVLKSAEIAQKAGGNPDLAQNIINELLQETMKFVLLKRMAKNNNIHIDWKSMDIKVKRTD